MTENQIGALIGKGKVPRVCPNAMVAADGRMILAAYIEHVHRIVHLYQPGRVCPQNGNKSTGATSDVNDRANRAAHAGKSGLQGEFLAHLAPVTPAGSEAIAVSLCVYSLRKPCCDVPLGL